MTSPVRTVRHVEPDGWEAARDLRLRALEEAPTAFGTTLEHARQLTEADWRARVTEAAWFICWERGEPVALATGVRTPGRDPRPGDHELTSMWAAPEVRGTGTSSTVLDAVMRWALDDGATRLVAWVVDGNEHAKAFYERLGLTPTGRTQKVRDGAGRSESELARELVRR